MHISECREQGTTTLELRGPLYGDRCATLRESVRHSLEEGTEQLVIDLQHVPAIDAEGVGTLVELRRVALAGGASLEVVHVPAHVLRLLQLAGVTDLIDTGGSGVWQPAHHDSHIRCIHAVERSPSCQNGR